MDFVVTCCSKNLILECLPLCNIGSIYQDFQDLLPIMMTTFTQSISYCSYIAIVACYKKCSIMHLLLSVLPAAASVVITSSYNNYKHPAQCN